MNECLVHGHRLKHALDRYGIERDLKYAFKNNGEDYFCPNEYCGIPVAPRGEKSDRANLKKRISYFAAEPRKSGPRRKPVPSKRGVVREAIRDSLDLSMDFDWVEVNPFYFSEKYKKGAWEDCRNFPVDVYASRRSRDPIDVAIHIIDLEKDGSTRISYNKIKEIASENLRNKRRFLVNGNEEIPLPDKIHQNIVVIKNSASHVPAGEDQVMLNPTVYNYTTIFTQQINYFDPDTLLLEPTWIWNGLPVISDHYDSRKVYYERHDSMKTFTLSPQETVRIEKKYSNRNQRAIIIPKLKRTGFIHVRLGEDGRPMFPKRAPRQAALF